MLQKTAKRAAKTATHLPGAIAKRFRKERQKIREEDALWESKKALQQAKKERELANMKGSSDNEAGKKGKKGSMQMENTPMLTFVPVPKGKKGETNRQRKQRLREMILGD